MGYVFPPIGGRGGINGTHTIEVDVNHLQNNSNIDVECQCDTCGKTYIQRWSRNKNECGKCVTSRAKRGNQYGTANKGKKIPSMTGENHPRWNPERTEMLKYSGRVHHLTKKTYETNKHIINPNDHPRTRCGVEGGYQLDHIVGIKEGFHRGIPPEELARVENLQMLPWKKNRDKW